MALRNQEKAIILNSRNIFNMLILLRVIEGTFRDQRHLKCSKTCKSDQRHSKVIEDIQKWSKTWGFGLSSLLILFSKKHPYKYIYYLTSILTSIYVIIPM